MSAILSRPQYVYSKYICTCCVMLWIRLTHRDMKKWPPLCWRHCHRHFLEWKFCSFDLHFIKICPRGCNWRPMSIVSGNGLATPGNKSLHESMLIKMHGTTLVECYPTQFSGLRTETIYYWRFGRLSFWQLSPFRVTLKSSAILYSRYWAW